MFESTCCLSHVMIHKGDDRVSERKLIEIHKIVNVDRRQ